jgi:hypothetical protein
MAVTGVVLCVIGPDVGVLPPPPPALPAPPVALLGPPLVVAAAVEALSAPMSPPEHELSVHWQVCTPETR